MPSNNLYFPSFAGRARQFIDAVSFRFDSLYIWLLQGGHFLPGSLFF